MELGGSPHGRLCRDDGVKNTFSYQPLSKGVTEITISFTHHANLFAINLFNIICRLKLSTFLTLYYRLLGVKFYDG